jgi:hypothetical protein
MQNGFIGTIKKIFDMKHERWRDTKRKCLGSHHDWTIRIWKSNWMKWNLNQSWNVTKRWTLAHLVTIITIIEIISLNLPIPRIFCWCPLNLSFSITTPICTKRAQMVINCVYYKSCRIRVLCWTVLDLNEEERLQFHTKNGTPSWVLGPVLEKHGSGRVQVTWSWMNQWLTAH